MASSGRLRAGHLFCRAGDERLVRDAALEQRHDHFAEALGLRRVRVPDRQNSVQPMSMNSCSVSATHGLRPLVASLAGVSAATGVYATPGDFTDGVPGETLAQRLVDAVDEVLCLAG